MSSMSDADWEALGLYARSIADIIGLRDWTLLLKRDPPLDEEVLGNISAPYGRKYAVLRVCLEFRDLSRDEVRQVIVHELVHCHHANLGHVLARTLKTELGHAGEVLMETIKAEFEHLVDAIATQWAEGLPYLDWPTPDPSVEQATNAPYEGPIDVSAQTELQT